MVKIQVNLTNKTFYTILVAVLLLVVSGIVFAYNSNLQPSVMGHTTNEIEFNSTITLEMYIREIVNDQIAGGVFDCQPTPNYDSYSGGIATKKLSTINMPPGCKSEVGCVILQEVYDKSGLKMKRQYNFNQDSRTNTWWSTYQSSGKYKNGDTTASSIVPNYNGLYLLDDYPKTVSGNSEVPEKDSSKFTADDTSTSYGQKIYICSPREF